MYYNESGKFLCAKTGKICKKGLTFLDIVIQDQKKLIEGLIKSVARGYVKPVEVLLLDKAPDADSKELEDSVEQKQLGLNVMNIKQGIFYEML
jgi:hypothetical protein